MRDSRAPTRRHWRAATRTGYGTCTRRMCSLRSRVPRAASLLGVDRPRSRAGSAESRPAQLRDARVAQPAPTRRRESRMSRSLLVKPDLSPSAAQVHRITPQSAGWRYVGFEVFDLAAGRTLERCEKGREQCLVLLSGRA